MLGTLNPRPALIAIRESFWFVPALLVLACAALALAMVEVDAALPSSYFADLPRLFGAGAEGSRALLSAIATSIMTVAGVVFSINIVALSLAAAQYSPHVLQNFMRDRTNQTVLGIFLGIYSYCVIVLRTVRGGGEAFVPGASIVVGILLALVGVAFLIFFIHHISVSIRVSHIVAQIAGETRGVIERVYPDGPSPTRRERSADKGDEGDDEAVKIVQQHPPGYVEHVDYCALADLAAAAGGLVRVRVAVGDFVLPGQPLVELRGTKDRRKLPEHRVRRAIAIGHGRNIDQDVSFGLQQLVDIGLRALSNSNNDATTAVHALEHLTVLLAMLARRDLDAHCVFRKDGRVVLECVRPSFDDYVRAVADPLRREARGNVHMLERLACALTRVGRSTSDRDALGVVIAHIEALEETVRGASFDRADADLLEAAIQRALRELNALPHSRRAADRDGRD